MTKLALQHKERADRLEATCDDLATIVNDQADAITNLNKVIQLHVKPRKVRESSKVRESGKANKATAVKDRNFKTDDP